MDSGPDGSAAGRSEEIERRKRADIAQINKIFGIADPNADLAGDIVKPAAYRRDGLPGTTQRMVLESPEVRTPGSTAKQWGDEVAANAEGRERYYSKLAADTNALNTAKASEQQQTAKRNLKFQLARQGLDSGSVDIDQNALLGRTYDEGLREGALGVDRLVSNAKTADERTRLNTIDRIMSGADASSAMTSATQGLEGNRAAANIEAQGGTIGDIFDNAGLLYQINQGTKRQAAMAPYYERAMSLFGGNGGSYSGSVSK